MSQLLEGIGAITWAVSKKAAGQATAYQDAVSLPVNRSLDDDAVVQDDEKEDIDDIDIDASIIRKVVSAIFCVRLLNHFLNVQLCKIVRTVCSSPQQCQAWFKEAHYMLCERVDGFIDTTLMLILDVRTRWSSTHQMLRLSCQFEASNSTDYYQWH